MPEDNSLEKRINIEKGKKLLRYYITKEGEMPNMEDTDNTTAWQYFFEVGYLLKKQLASPEVTQEGRDWAYS